MCADLKSDAVRTFPQRFDQADRAAYVAIAQRSRVEAINCYTVMALGLQAYVENINEGSRRA